MSKSPDVTLPGETPPPDEPPVIAIAIVEQLRELLASTGQLTERPQSPREILTSLHYKERLKVVAEMTRTGISFRDLEAGPATIAGMEILPAAIMPNPPSSESLLANAPAVDAALQGKTRELTLNALGAPPSVRQNVLTQLIQQCAQNHVAAKQALERLKKEERLQHRSARAKLPPQLRAVSGPISLSRTVMRVLNNIS